MASRQERRDLAALPLHACHWQAPTAAGWGAQASLHSVAAQLCVYMCRPTRGSLHYDPYSNLLCVARGSKTVLLLPPSAAPALAAQPLTAESANHSPADLSALDLRRFPGLQAVLPQVRLLVRWQRVLFPGSVLVHAAAPQRALPGAWRVVWGWLHAALANARRQQSTVHALAALPLRHTLLQVRRFQLAAGDALFIPEGWWHQVRGCSKQPSCPPPQRKVTNRRLVIRRKRAHAGVAASHALCCC